MCRHANEAVQGIGEGWEHASGWGLYISQKMVLKHLQKVERLVLFLMRSAHKHGILVISHS